MDHRFVECVGIKVQGHWTVNLVVMVSVSCRGHPSSKWIFRARRGNPPITGQQLPPLEPSIGIQGAGSPLNYFTFPRLVTNPLLGSPSAKTADLFVPHEDKVDCEDIGLCEEVSSMSPTWPHPGRRWRRRARSGECVCAQRPRLRSKKKGGVRTRRRRARGTCVRC